MKKLSLVIITLIIGFGSAFAQDDLNPITTAAPFLLIAPDARGGGMGDMGVATSPDANSQFYNAAQNAFASSEWQIAINYTPWLRNLTNDVSLTSALVTNRINEKSAWSAGITYFSLGTIDLTDDIGQPIGTENPNEFAVSGAYSMKLSENFSMAVGLRYINSNLSIRINQSDFIQTVNTFAVDLSGYYQGNEQNYGDFNGKWRGGFNISNMGPKVELVVGAEESFIPTNLKLGGGFDFILDNVNTITANVEFSKLLVPTPSISIGGDGEPPYRQADVGFLQGMFQSFYDAPRGFEEELEEVTWGVSTEYMYNQVFALRAGYFHESPNKGNRQFFTMGAGFRFRSSTLDLSYLINASDVNNPLESTLRFSLSINLGDVYDYF
ncbi:MAG: type IX secretion system outer membrane channel protein PorV [Flavobacteriaceae bacterium]|nr:type IX secretion system outer membrane channel protein PorV [Flavobacteriaceae bacterium]